MNIIKIISLIFLLSIAFSSKAKITTFVVEPMLKFHTSGDMELLDTTYSLSKFEGTLGLGVQYQNLIMRLDLSGTSLSITTPDGSASEGFIGYSYGVALGKSYFNNNIRLWAGYIPKTQITSSEDKSTYNGTGYYTGLSFTIYRPVHFLIEYKSETHSTRVLPTGEKTSLEGNQQLESSSIFVGLSLPWVL